MKILQINKFFYLNGGISRYFFEVSRLLSSHFHTIAYFAMKNDYNIVTKWNKYFVKNISLNEIKIKNIIDALDRFFYSRESKKNISLLLNDFSADISHIHSIDHHISTSILSELRHRNIPIVQTLHDYHLISPNRYLFHNGKICELTKNNKYYYVLLHKCIKNSYWISFLEMVEKYYQLLLGWERFYVDYFISPSNFIKNKLVDYGLPEEKIIYLPHFVDYKQYKPNYNQGGYILYFGRLSHEKGLNYLIDAMKLLPKIKLFIVGSGNKAYVEKLKIQTKELINIKFIGFKDGVELKKIIANSRFTILSSVWNEAFGLSIPESFASGKPVIASNIGGIPEIVKDGFNGLLVQPGNIDDLAYNISKLWNDRLYCRQLGRNSREYVENNFNPESHYEKLMQIYKKAIALHK